LVEKWDLLDPSSFALADRTRPRSGASARPSPAALTSSRSARDLASRACVAWVEGAGDRRDERWEWLRAQDVMRSVRWLVPPARA